jgi:hypothetical protein
MAVNAGIGTEPGKFLGTIWYLLCNKYYTGEATMKNLSVALLFCLISSIAHAQEIIDLQKPLKCSDAQSVMNYFVDKHKETPIWVGKSVHNTHITLLMNRETRSWTMIEYDAKLACVLGAGEDRSGSSPEI